MRRTELGTIRGLGTKLGATMRSRSTLQALRCHPCAYKLFGINFSLNS